MASIENYCRIEPIQCCKKPEFAQGLVHTPNRHRPPAYFSRRKQDGTQTLQNWIASRGVGGLRWPSLCLIRFLSRAVVGVTRVLSTKNTDDDQIVSTRMRMQWKTFIFIIFIIFTFTRLRMHEARVNTKCAYNSMCARLQACECKNGNKRI